MFMIPIEEDKEKESQDQSLHLLDMRLQLRDLHLLEVVHLQYEKPEPRVIEEEVNIIDTVEEKEKK